MAGKKNNKKNAPSAPAAPKFVEVNGKKVLITSAQRVMMMGPTGKLRMEWRIK